MSDELFSGCCPTCGQRAGRDELLELLALLTFNGRLTRDEHDRYLTLRAKYDAAIKDYQMENVRGK